MVETRARYGRDKGEIWGDLGWVTIEAARRGEQAPYISPISHLYLAYISPISRLYLTRCPAAFSPSSVAYAVSAASTWGGYRGDAAEIQRRYIGDIAEM